MLPYFGAEIIYILQRINKYICKRPDLITENIQGVTTFLREQIIAAGGDPDRETLNVIKYRDLRGYYVDPDYLGSFASSPKLGQKIEVCLRHTGNAHPHCI